MNENKDDSNTNKTDPSSGKIEVVIGDSSDLKFSEVGDYMGDLKPHVMKGSIKNIIIPTSKKKSNKDSDEKEEVTKTPSQNEKVEDESENENKDKNPETTESQE